MENSELVTSRTFVRKSKLSALWVSLFLLVVFASSLFRIEDGDTWWHLKTGQLILESRQVPRVDPYSLLSPGKRWVDHEWLFQVIVHEIDSAFGARGLVLFRAVTVLLVFTVLFFYARKEGVSREGAVFLLSIAFVVARSRFFVRPEIVSFLLFVLLLFTLLSPPRRPVLRYGFPIFLMVVWANVHATCLYGVLAAFAIAAGELLAAPVPETPRGPEPGTGRLRRALRIVGLPLAVLLSTFVNPYGYAIYRPAFELRKIVRLPHVPNPEWLHPPLADFPWFYGLLGFVVIVLAFTFTKQRDFRRLFLAVVFAGLGLTYLRNVGFFALSSVFVLSGPLSRPSSSGRSHSGFLWGGLTVALLSSYFLFSDNKSYGLGWRDDQFPFREVDFIEQRGIRGRIFTEVIFGDYLIYRQYPRERVFIDGRNEIHEELLREIFADQASTEKWSAFLAKYDLDIALLRYPPTLQGVIYSSRGGKTEKGYRAWSAVYFPKNTWALVYWDDVAMVFVRREPKFAGLISSCEYRIVHPDDWKHQLEEVSTGKLDRQDILREILRKLRENPGCARASRLLALFSEKQALAWE